MQRPSTSLEGIVFTRIGFRCLAPIWGSIVWLTAAVAQPALLPVGQESSAGEDRAHQVDDENLLLHVHRYLGFRAIEEERTDTDYTFSVNRDGRWHYRSLIGQLERRGELGDEIDEFSRRVTGWLEEVKDQRQAGPVIADLPVLAVRWRADRRLHDGRLEVQSPRARRLHRLVKAIVDDQLDWKDFDREEAMDVKRVELPEEFLAQVMGEVPRLRQFGDPQVVTDVRELQRHLGHAAAAQHVDEQVDWEKQKVLLFLWSGSGQDRLTWEVEAGEAADETPRIKITYHAGMTRDLRRHVQVLAVDKDARWVIERAR